MTRAPVSIQAHESIAKAMALLAELDVRHLPVLDDGQLVGILSDRDLTPLRDRGDLDELAASNLMSSDVLSVTEEADLGEAVDLMLEHRVGALPVVASGDAKLTGILSYVDVLRALRSRLP